MYFFQLVATLPNNLLTTNQFYQRGVLVLMYVCTNVVQREITDGSVLMDEELRRC